MNKVRSWFMCTFRHFNMDHYKPVTHVIFDWDGTLINTEGEFTNFLQSIAGKYGKDLTRSMRAHYLGIPVKERVADIIRTLDLPITTDEFHEMVIKKFNELSSDRISGCKLLPGAERLVKHLYKNNIPTAIATGSSKVFFETSTSNFQELLKYFHHTVLSPNDPEVERSKPAPDVFLVCANRFDEKPPPEQVLVFEDAPNGVESAVAAGMQVVLVRDPSLDNKYCKNATIVLDSLEDFQPELFGLPPFPNEQ